MSLEPDNPTFTLAVLGDLHLDPSDMDAHEEARDHVVHHLENEAFLMETKNQHVISLGDLGAYGSAGTTACFEHAREFLDGFDSPVSLVTGNHDLEGLDEFDSDGDNLRAWQEAFGVDQPQFAEEVAKKTLCIGLSTVRFRDAEHSSHEVFIDDEQLTWFESQLAAHPDEDGWRVLVFTHAPPMGSGLRVVQGVHIKNQCAWLNHSGDERRRRAFLRMCRKHRCIKAWFSGHFHLSHDYEDSVSVAEGCTFVQVGVMGEQSTRDGRRQTRLVRGTEDAIQIYTVSHHRGGDEFRLDVTINNQDPTHPVQAHGHEDYDHSSWFSSFNPQPEDGCYLVDTGEEGGVVAAGPHDREKVCWWHMKGRFEGDEERVLGVHGGMVVEYDSELLAPLGIVRDNLQGREVVVIEDGEAVMLVPQDENSGDVEVIHPNKDGSYCQTFQRNKAIRTQEKQREARAKAWLNKARAN